MSLNGWVQAELEHERLEQARLNTVRELARDLLVLCETKFGAVRKAEVQQLAARGLKAIRQDLNTAAQVIAAGPDRGLKYVQDIHRRLHAVIADAEAKANAWSREQAKTQARVAETQARASTVNGARPEVAGAIDQQIKAARDLQGQGRHAEAAAACDQAEDMMKKAEAAALDEAVRREVVRGLMAALRANGFVVAGPALHAGDNGGRVTLVGNLPSGRKARFDVHLDGRMEFDLDGYEGRLCGKEMQGIESVLRERFSVRLGPAQVTWKDNPQRISKGARDLPTGGAYAR